MMSHSTFPDVSRVFENQQHVQRFSRLHDASAFPAIGKIGPQVCGMTVRGSSTPKFNQLPSANLGASIQKHTIRIQAAYAGPDS